MSLRIKKLCSTGYSLTIIQSRLDIRPLLARRLNQRHISVSIPTTLSRRPAVELGTARDVADRLEDLGGYLVPRFSGAGETFDW